MDALEQFVASRAGAPLALEAELLSVIDTLAAAGRAVELVLVDAQRAMALGPRDSTSLTQLVADLSALSRSTAAAREHAVTSSVTLRRIHRGEHALREELRMRSG
jgi:hypothetical protein